MTLASLAAASRATLAPAERRVADHMLAEPHAVAFGTVASIAEATHTSGATVVRLASKLGFDGFTQLQRHVQADLADRMRPAAERIHMPAPGDIVGEVMATETRNLHATLASIDRADYERAVRRLAETPGRVLVLSGEGVRGVGELLAAHLGLLRPGVGCIEGNAQQVGRTLADLSGRDTVVAIDFRRYDRWLLAAAQHISSLETFVVSCTDSPLSPLAGHAEIVFAVSAVGVGPFDSYIAAHALANALLAGVARQLTGAAAGRLERIEQNWRALDALAEEP